jgi:Cys-tRNA synthase (O-phospho-L-seryl-tRNA:Cys-tRNA synthase)
MGTINIDNDIGVASGAKSVAAAANVGSGGPSRDYENTRLQVGRLFTAWPIY